LSALKGMISFFTMIRLDITEKDVRDMNERFYLAPAAGAFYGLIAAFLMFAFSQALPMILSSVLTLFAIHAMNRFLHIDGTIDVGDGVTVAGSREDHLRALKDTNIGAGGMAFAMFVTIASVAAMSGLSQTYIFFIPFAAEILAKNAMVSAAAFGIPSDGMAGESVRNTGLKGLAASSFISAAFIAAMMAVNGLTGWFGVTAELIAVSVILIAVSVLTGKMMSSVARRNFGSVNGDVLGASNEISRMIVLICALAFIAVV